MKISLISNLCNHMKDLFQTRSQFDFLSVATDSLMGLFGAFQGHLLGDSTLITLLNFLPHCRVLTVVLFFISFDFASLMLNPQYQRIVVKVIFLIKDMRIFCIRIMNAVEEDWKLLTLHWGLYQLPYSLVHMDTDQLSNSNSLALITRGMRYYYSFLFNPICTFVKEQSPQSHSLRHS